ncbi:SWIM zinc finger family protein [Alicyclobacillus suci]|uniref:SWIM zinc finger family protein n=1 Tax=Alicyclobacillus suci TaxID=2816080 RepID=UPI001A8C37E5|nr:SWIM zinc finger family protein [Alicyclobacillus suci]
MTVVIDEAELEQFGYQLLKAMPEHILNRGLSYYHEGRVVFVEMVGRTLVADVTGSEFYDVALDLDWVHMRSRCSCPYEDICKHMAAVFFEVYAMYQSPEVFVAKLLASRAGEQGGVPTLNTTSPVAPEPEVLAKLQEDDDFDTWLNALRHGIGYADEKTIYHQALSLDNRVERAKEVCATWSDNTRDRFELLLYLYAMQTAGTLLGASLSDNYYARTLEMALRRYGSFISSLLNTSRVSSAAADAAWNARLVQFIREGFVRQATPNESILQTVCFVYEYWLAEVLSLSEEIAWWEDVEADSSQHRQEIVRLMLSYFYTKAGDDAKAWLMLDGLDPKFRAVFYFINLDVLVRERAWARAYGWLKHITSDDVKLRQWDLWRLSENWVVVAQHHEDARSDCEAFLTENESLSQPYLMRFYIMTEQYRAWVDYCLFNDLTITGIEREELRHVEKAAPEYLLPLYHQAVERCIRLKNRAAYKVAVRHLKKLSTLYKKLKRQDDWVRFLNQFTSRYTRLRALQDEMRKRGVIT